MIRRDQPASAIDNTLPEPSTPWFNCLPFRAVGVGIGIGNDCVHGVWLRADPDSGPDQAVQLVQRFSHRQSPERGVDRTAIARFASGRSMANIRPC